MKDYGMSFRLLRKERGFTLKTMSEGIISYSYLSKFEKGESDITFRNFVLLIERLNMTLDEFLFSITLGQLTILNCFKPYLSHMKKMI